MNSKKNTKLSKKVDNGSELKQEENLTNQTKNIKRPKDEGFKHQLLWETDISKKNHSIVAFQILFPFILVFLFFIILYYSLSWSMFSRLGAGSVLYFFPPAGKESVIPGLISGNVNPYLVIMVIVFIDVITSLFLIWNMDYVKKVPLFGNLLRFIEKHGQRILKERKFAKYSVYIMLIVFVMVPFQGSGGAGATIIGKIIGAKPYRIWACVLVGSLLGVSIITKAALEAKEYIGEDLIWVVVGIFIFAAVYGVIGFIRGRLKEKNE
jgi:hypothetical protein